MHWYLMSDSINSASPLRRSEAYDRGTLPPAIQKKKLEAYDRETIPIETRKKKKKANALALFVH
jgi:hypothetical protein